MADARARLSFGAWRKVAGTGPIAKASERAFVEVKEETEILRTPAPAPKSAPRALADLTNAEVTPATSVKPTPGPTSVKPTPGPTPPRRFFNLIATPFARRRNRGGRDSDSPHSDWGSSESETSAESRAPESRGATSARSDWGSSESETSADASRAPESAGSTGSSAELWGSAGGRSPPPRAAQPRRNVGETTRPRSHPPVVSSTAWRCPRATRARARRSARRRTTRRRRPSPPSPRPNRRSSPLRRPRGTPPPRRARGGTHPHRVFPREPRGGGVGGGASTTRTRRRHRRGFRRRGKRRLPGPASMARVGHKLSGLHTATVYTLSPTSPLVGPRDGAPSRSPSTSSGSESGSTRRTSPPGDNAAAAAVRGGHVAAARAVFEREAAMRSYESHSSPVVPHRGSRVRR